MKVFFAIGVVFWSLITFLLVFTEGPLMGALGLPFIFGCYVGWERTK